MTRQRHPVFPTSTTPIYSNAAFQLLGYALENITATPFETMFNRSIVTPLGLTRTSYNLPLDNAQGVIPSTSPATTWGVQGKDFNPAGGIYSTANDLARLGRAILTSQLIPASLTRRWMKPVTHTADLRLSVGAPWEIERLTLPAPQEKIVDLYGKGGDLGSYHTSYVLIPDWEIGYVVMIADDPAIPSSVNTDVKVFINQLVLPTIEQAARREADRNYAGHYRAKDPNLNSSMIITTDPESLGLGVKQFISNGTDMFSIFNILRRNLPAENVSITLYPTGLVDSVGGKKEAWRAVIGVNGASALPGVAGCISWAAADSLIIGGIADDEFAFVVGDDGRATSVESRALRVSMERVKEI
jgi:hypothetical protein